MKKLFIIIVLFLFNFCTSRLSYQELAKDLIIKSVKSNPIGMYKSDFLKIYQPYSKLFISPYQSDHFLNEDHVASVTLNNGNKYYFRSNFLNDTCVSVDYYFHDKIDTSVFVLIKSFIARKYGQAVVTHKNETGGHLSFKANIDVYTWKFDGIITNIEYDVDSTTLHFVTENTLVKDKVERVILTKIVYEKPHLINKPVIEIPDSIKYKYSNYKGRSIFQIEIDTTGRIQNYIHYHGDSLFNSYIVPTFKDYLFKPALNKYGDPIPSKLMIPINFDYTIDTVKSR